MRLIAVAVCLASVLTFLPHNFSTIHLVLLAFSEDWHSTSPPGAGPRWDSSPGIGGAGPRWDSSTRHSTSPPGAGPCWGSSPGIGGAGPRWDSSAAAACIEPMKETGLPGGDLETVLHVRNAAACCGLCWSRRARPHSCKAYTWINSGDCYLKGSTVGEPEPHNGATSGYLHMTHGIHNAGAKCPADTPAAERQLIADVFANAVKRRKARVQAEEKVRRSQQEAARWPYADIVLVTAWGRTEFFLSTMEHLIEAVGVDQHRFVFMLDDEFDARILCIIDAWPHFKGKTTIFSARHEWMTRGSWGNTFNTLEVRSRRLPT
jgi:hypothetical protein